MIEGMIIYIRREKDNQMKIMNTLFRKKHSIVDHFFILIEELSNQCPLNFLYAIYNTFHLSTFIK